MMLHCTLDGWIAYLEALHSQPIDLTLGRIAQVWSSLNLRPTFRIITVGGTNGKGSVCAILSSLLKEAGYCVGTYTSPHVLRYNERIAVNLLPLTDQTLMAHFAAIEAARGKTTLTFFEFLTLAAMREFIVSKVDIAVLEVGMGGRLDAVNLFDADVAVVTNVALDHCDYLGKTCDAIGFEKAGIFRPQRPAIVSEKPPDGLLQEARKIGADLYEAQRDFEASGSCKSWSFRFGKIVLKDLKLEHLKATYQIDNAALALAALSKLPLKCAIVESAIKAGLKKAQWPWRLMFCQKNPTIILDVAHNPHGVLALTRELALLPLARRRLAVFSMLADKDIDACLQIAKTSFDQWYIAGLEGVRGLSSQALFERFERAGINNVCVSLNIQEAWQKALSAAQKSDRIVVFGSFHTIAAVEKARGVF